jgi:hypothetical protein
VETFIGWRFCAANEQVNNGRQQTAATAIDLPGLGVAAVATAAEL